MTRALIITLVVSALLSGCTTVYVPNILDTTDASKAQVASDVALCAQEALQFHRPFNPIVAATTGGQGFASNLSSAALSTTQWWLGPLLGGGGGILNYIAQWVGLIDVDTPRAEQQCVRQRLDRDRAGILVEPPL